MAFLTDRTLATGVTTNDLIHIVITGDTSQNPAGSSYKATMGQVLDLINPTTITGGTYDSITGSITFYDDNGGSFVVTGLVTGFTDTNFANTDLTFTGNRTHNTNNNYLWIQTNGVSSGATIYMDSTNWIDVGFAYFNNFTRWTPTYVDHFFNNISRMLLTSGETSFNDGNGNIDFRIKGTGDSDLIYVLASSDYVGIGNATPSEKLDVSGKTKTINFQMTSGATNGYFLISDGNGNASWSPLSNVSGSSIISVTEISASTYTATTSFSYYGVTFTGNTDITIPSASGIDGYTFRIKDEKGNSGSYRIRITPSLGTIDGNSYVDMNINYMSLTLVARNNNWWII